MSKHSPRDVYASAHVVNRTGYPDGSLCHYCGHREAIGLVRDVDPETGVVSYDRICEPCNTPVPPPPGAGLPIGLTGRERWLEARRRIQDARAADGGPGHDPEE